MENQTQHNQGVEKKKWITPELEVLSQKETLGGTGFDFESLAGLYS